MALLKGRFALGIALVAALAGGVAAPRSATAQAPEYALKAAMLVQFAKFVEWPASRFSAPGAPFVIGVLGDDPFGNSLENIVKGQTVMGHPIVVWRYGGVDALDRASHMLFISQSINTQDARLNARLVEAGALTVSDIPGFAQRTGIVGFVLDRDRLGFEINVGTAERARLKISSRLLALAKTVILASNEAAR